MEDKKLTQEQIENWRKMPLITYGPIANLMSYEEIQEFRNKMQSYFYSTDAKKEEAK